MSKELQQATSTPEAAYGSRPWFFALSLPEYRNFVAHLMSKLPVLKPFDSQVRSAKADLLKNVEKALNILEKLPIAPGDIQGEVITVKRPFKKERTYQSLSHEQYNLLEQWYRTFFSERDGYGSKEYGIVTLMNLAQQYADQWAGLPIEDRMSLRLRQKHIQNAVYVSQEVTKLNGTQVNIFDDYVPLKNALPVSRVFRLDAATPQFKIINKRMVEIANLAGLANTGDVSVEEEHFLQQVINELLPEIANSAAKLEGASYDVLREAEQGYITQLDLIEQRLRQLIVAAHQRALSSVQVQTTFLEDKLTSSSKNQFALTEGEN